MRSRASLFALLYLSVIVYLTLFPWDFQWFPRSTGLVWVPITGRRLILDAYLNLLMFVPLGAAGFLALGRRWWSWALTIAACSLVSYCIEYLQLWTPNRTPNLTDWASNTAGAAIGVTVTWWLARQSWWPVLKQRSHQWKLSPDRALIGVLWLLWQATPFVPAIQLALIRQFWSWPAWNWHAFAELGITAAALTVALNLSPWLALALILLPAQVFLVGRGLSYASIAGALAGVLTARAARAWIERALPWLLTAWLVFEEFRPFHFEADPAGFSWQPFASWYSVPNSAEFYRVFLGKLFLYTATVWAFRINRHHWAVGILLPAVILACGEWSQRYLAGRTPESTDVVVLIGGAVLLAICSPQRAENGRRAKAPAMRA